MTLLQNKIEIKKRCYEDLYFFNKHILGYNLLDDDVHGSLCDFIQNTEGDLLDLEPRDHFKTTCISVGYVIWRMINNYNIKILLNVKRLEKAKEILSEIKEHFQRNKLFLHFFGDLIGETWRTDKILVNKKDKISKEPTISTGAIGHEVTGGHYNLIINDDLVGLADRYSTIERDGTINFGKALRYVRDKADCKEINIGTRWHTEDNYNYIITKRPKVIARIKSAEVKKGESYFKSRYTWQDLKDLENEDPLLYAAQMKNDPQPLESQLYNIDKLKKFDMDSFKARHNVAYIDPAFGKKEKNDPCFFCMCIGSIVDNNIYVVEWITNKNSADSNESLVSSKAVEWKLKGLGIESNAAQSVWADNVQKALNKNKIILNVEQKVATVNKDRRIQSMHGAVVNNVYFRNDWDVAYPEAMSQLLNYPYHKYKDAPDCLEGLISIAINRSNPTIRWI